ncbi:TonB family protein [Siccibacter colletis]|uniref:TonB family protein n=1 Tax=Siccibacter colletis TaxID=1505757 RepID=UPI003CF28147
MITQDLAQTTHFTPAPAARNGRAGLWLCLSVGVHALLLFALYQAVSPSPLNLPHAGRSGGEMSVMLLAASPATAEPQEIAPVTTRSASPKSVEAERADIQVEKKSIARKTPEPSKKAVNKPVTTPKKPAPLRETVRNAPPAPPSPKPAETRLTPAPQPAVASVAASSASRPGESESGNAAQGAGNATSSVVRILHRRVNYPNRARAMGLEGQVKVKFDITAAGTITNIRILAETPRDVFSSDLRRDISRWRYVTTGPVNDRVVTVIFKIDGRIQLIS